MARTIALWVFGLFPSAIVGGYLANQFMSFGSDLFGALAGMSAFACLRLWLTESPQNGQG
jgi:hypothetical protein